jgi:hypothetical protein
MGTWCPAIAGVTCKNWWWKNSEKKGLAARPKHAKCHLHKKLRIWIQYYEMNLTGFTGSTGC